MSGSFMGYGNISIASKHAAINLNESRAEIASAPDFHLGHCCKRKCRTRASEPVIDAELELLDPLLDVPVVDSTPHRGRRYEVREREIAGSEVEIGVLGLRRPVAEEGVFDAATDGPAGAGLGDGGNLRGNASPRGKSL